MNTPITAKAVTFGETVADAAQEAPYVVSIWNLLDKTDEREATFICSGSLVAPKIILTAAHCTTLTTPYFVKIGARTLQERKPFVSASGWWTSTRYDSKRHINDIGLLSIDEPVTGIEFPTIANDVLAKSINAKSKFTLFGWGDNQNGLEADLLRYAVLQNQDKASKKLYKEYFNPITQISAGRKIKNENLWAGACNGDSGGPLVTRINGLNVIAGVVSWGAKNCIKNYPTVFSRASYYFKDIQKGFKSVESKSISDSRIIPIALEEPIISGEAAPGKEIICQTGQWKDANNLRIIWSAPPRIAGISKPNVIVQNLDGGKTFECEIVVTSKSNASVIRRISKTVVGKLQVQNSPAISGLNSSSMLKTGSEANCDSWSWKSPPDSESVSWFTASSPNPSLPVNGRKLGSGKSLILNSSQLRGENGRYLICQVTGVKDGFETYSSASYLIKTPLAPTNFSVNVSASSLSTGSTASCKYDAYGEFDDVRYEWGSSSNGFFQAIGNQNSSSITIDNGFIQQAAGKNLACKVTLGNLGGELSRIGTTWNAFESLPPAPSVTASISGSVVAGAMANCSVGYSNLNKTLNWGITSSPGASNFESGIIGSNSSYQLTSNDLLNFAGKYLTCVVTVSNTVGSNSNTSSIYIPTQFTNVPTPNAPTVTSQNAGSTSISATFSIPSLVGFDSNKMNLYLNVISSPGCLNLKVNPGANVTCDGLKANTTYSANLTTSEISKPTNSKTSTNLSFTTVSLAQDLYVCGSSCTGSLNSNQQTYYLSDKRLIEAQSQSGGPITSSTCKTVGCEPGIAPALPISCGSGSSEKTGLVANATAFITTHFRYCSAPLDSVAPSIRNDALSRTGYASIRPTSGAPGTPITVRWSAADNIGISSTQIRLVNPGNVVVNTSNGNFIAGSTSDGVYEASIYTANTGPLNGDVYQIQAKSFDAAGNSSVWATLGTFTVSIVDTTGPVVSNLSVSPTSITANSYINVKMSAVDTSGVRGCGAEVFNSNNQSVAASDISTLSSGFYTVSIYLNSSNNPGTYSVRGYCKDNLLNQAFSSASANFVINGPTISSITTIPAPQTIGINYSDQIVLNGFDLTTIGTTASSFDWTIKTTTSTGTLVSTIPKGSNQTYITGLSPSTSYKVYLIATDYLGATKTSAALSISTIIAPDTQAPITDIGAATVSPSKLFENQSIVVNVPISDNVGVSSVSGLIVLNSNSVLNPNSGQGLTSGTFNLTRTSGTSKSGTWSATVGMNFKWGASDGYLLPGIYDIVLTSTDTSNNASQVTISTAFELGSQAGGPVVTTFSATPGNGGLRAGGEVIVSARIVAYNQSISLVNFTSDGYNLSRSGTMNFVSGNSSDQIVSASIPIPAGLNSGIYSIQINANTANGRSGNGVFQIQVTN